MVVKDKLVKPKILFILLDGLGDLPFEDWKNTPLGEAQTPCFDSLAKNGICGLMDPVQPGLACGSDTAHLSLFGYPPQTYYNGRGAFESMGSGMEMLPGDVAFKSIFSFMDSDQIVVKRRADRNFVREGPILCEFLDGLTIPGFPDVSVSIKYATEHRCAVRIRGKNNPLSDSITGTDPLVDNKPGPTSEPLNDSREAFYTAKVVNALAEEMARRLKSHPINIQRRKEGKIPANTILLRGPGMKLKVPSFESRFGLRSAFIAPTCIIKGIGLSIGLDSVDVAGATGDMETNVDAKMQRAVSLLLDEPSTSPASSYDMVFVHVKGVDDASHEGLFETKRDLIAACDKALQGALNSYLVHPHSSPLLIAITGDHTTPCYFKDHTCHSVPFLISPFSPSFSSGSEQSKWVPDSVEAFTEYDCESGSLGRFSGQSLVGILLTAQERLLHRV
eukprot:GCRY01001586.1.p1 GENE.GCRY01001586.1~~GCRY01001586.1.p1  ORF type:complete len:447 (-),score=32.33 GCRY01001586.1:583-1923(-)